MSWLEEAKLLPLGHKARSDCPQCGAGTNTNAAVINHSHKSYSLYCHACGYNPFELKGDLSIKELKELRELNERANRYIASDNSRRVKLPDDYTTDIPIEGRLWLYKAGLSETDIRKYRIGYSKYLERVVLPVCDNKGSVIWYQCRAIFEGQKPKYLQPKRDRSTVYFCSHKDWTISKHVIFVEDILSAIKVGKVQPAVSLLGTKISDELSGVFSQAEKCTTWLDSDRAGQQGARNIRKRLSLVTEVANIVTKKDPKLLSTEEIREILCQQ